MKKIFAIMLVLIPTLALLTACGGNKENNDKSLQSADNTLSNKNSSSNIDFAAIFEGKSNIKLTGLSESEKQAIIDAGKVKDVQVTFLDDEHTIFERLSDGYAAICTPDGWSFHENWLDRKAHSEWPDNEFARLIPKPDFALFTAVSTTHTFNAVFYNITVAMIKGYAEKVKAAGFTIDASDDETNTTFIYTASNSNGYSVILRLFDDDEATMYITMTKK